MGFGCNVPAIMATRAIESRKSRLITIAIIPFMSCAGRLPIFVLLAGAFFPNHSALALLGIYFLGVLLAILSAMILSRFVKEDDLPFVMELPPYRVPTGKALWRHTWEKGKQYLEKMATTILIGSVVIWCLGYFPRSGRDVESGRQGTGCQYPRGHVFFRCRSRRGQHAATVCPHFIRKPACRGGFHAVHPALFPLHCHLRGHKE